MIEMLLEKDEVRYYLTLHWADSDERASFIKNLLEFWNWDFEWGLTHNHPSNSGNCDHDETDMIAHGNFREGGYMNAASYCSQCFWSSNPAFLDWDEKSIWLNCDLLSKKVISIFAALYECNKNAYYECVEWIVEERKNGLLEAVFKEVEEEIEDYKNHRDLPHSCESLLENIKKYL
jgi:hypothetical protein